MEKFQKICPLCEHSHLQPRSHATQADPLWECDNCGLIFKSRVSYLDWPQQKDRYDLHQNDPSDAGYEGFLNKLILPLLPYLKAGARILDWGSGPHPALKVLLEKRGWQVDIYDPIYASERPKGSYDVLVSTEVVEHFQNPRESFDEMISFLLKPAILAVMTEIYRPEIDFFKWWYVKDPTHVVFYQEKTIHYLARKYQMEILFFEKSIFILKKNN